MSHHFRLPLLVLALAAAGACDLLKNPNDPDPIPANVVNYTAVGASDAIGFGSSVVCVPFTDCPNGAGYVQILARHFKSDGKTTTLLNLGIPGAVLSPEIQAIGNTLHRDILTNLLDNELPFVSKDSTVVTIFTGGNDANTIGAALDAGLGGSDPNGYLQQRVANFGRDLKKLTDGIHERAPQARIVVLNLPNLAALPYASGYSLAQKRGLQQIAVAFSAQMNNLRSGGALIVDLMCNPGFYQAGIYSGDGFHPNDSGYALMADVAYPAMSSGTAPPPQASCAQMTLF
jgi:lysophospholipase L1-like esterase